MKKNRRIVVLLFVVLFSACTQKESFSQEFTAKDEQLDLISLMGNLYTGSYANMTSKQVRKLQIEEIKKRKTDFMKSLPLCQYERSNPDIHPQKLDPFLVNCKKVKKEGNLISGIGGLDPIWEIVNGTYSIINEGYVYSSALCNENDYFFRGGLSQSDSMYYKWANPLAARLKNHLIGKGLIDQINFYNREVGSLSMYGGRAFEKSALMGYAEKDGHYYLIGAKLKSKPICADSVIWSKVYIIDDQLYEAGERLYLDEMQETIKQSEWDLEGISGDVAIFKRMTDGQFKKGIGDPFDYQMEHGSAMTYQLETCDLPLKSNQDFVSYTGENKINPELTYRYQRENNEVLEEPLPCEGAGYFDELAKTDATYSLLYDPYSATYRKYIPELCATLSTSPLFLDREIHDLGDQIVLERKGNKIYNPIFYNKEPILIFENKERNQDLDLVLRKSAKKLHPNCQLIEHESEHYQVWSHEQAKAYAFIAPFVREGWRDQLPCVNKYEQEIGDRTLPMTQYNYYILADVRYPGMFAYTIDQGGNKHLGNNLTLFFGRK